ncbi:MAG: GNAT family N-acetyltransferase [Xanthomonadales bacterium]|nr:GNAT family N-acetyltransferase [Xanthomonadales bacterium]
MPVDRIDWAFETNRVRGRLVAEGDVDLYVELYADASVMRHIAEALSEDAAADMFAKALRHNANPAARARYWHLSHQRTGQTLGLAALVRDAVVPTRGELGLMLLPQAQHTGAGIQSLEGVVEGALSQRWRLGMDEVTGRHAAGNIGAARLVEHLGFEPFDIATPGSVGWRMTADAWRARLASR